jgi:hypothetical protein
VSRIPMVMASPRILRWAHPGRGTRAAVAHSVLLLCISLSPTLFPANPVHAAQRRAPLACVEDANDIAHGLRTADVAAAARVKAQAADGHSLCVAAELFRRAGDYRAQSHYSRAIQADPQEPAYELLLADYYRNYRGAGRPLFAAAEPHYHAARRKLDQLGEKLPITDAEIRDRITRGLVALYQEDGFPLLALGSDARDGARSRISFGSINRVGRSTAAFDEIDDVRAFTSEALFSASAARLNRALTPAELRGIARTTEQFDTTNRLRLRFGDAPSIDLFHQHQRLDNVQVTQFFAPAGFSDVRLNIAGVAMEKSINAAPAADLLLRIGYRNIERTGVVEFLPQVKENIDQFEASGAASRFLGPDKVTVEAGYVKQNIDADLAGAQSRERRIKFGKLSYLLARPLLHVQDPKDARFDTRGLDLYAGAVHDEETFGTAVVEKRNQFVGASLKGFTPFRDLNPFDLTIQPSRLQASVSGDPTRDNAQFRVDVVGLYRLVDEEAKPRELGGVKLSFLHLVVPLRHDRATEGPDTYENFKLGVALNAKVYSESLRGTTFLASLRYDFQRFYHLDRNLNLIMLTLSMGF